MSPTNTDPTEVPAATALSPATAAITLLCGAMIVLDIGGIRLLTDPTFDPPGEYPMGGGTSLVKTAHTAWNAGQVGKVAAVLLSHDQHPDELDVSGRAYLDQVPIVLTTPQAAARLGPPCRGLTTWERAHLARPDGSHLEIMAVPARHGPDGTEHVTGPVTGFVVRGDGVPSVYVSGDNAGLDKVEAIAARLGSVDIAVIAAGGAKVAALGDELLTLSSAMAVQAAAVLGAAQVVVVHNQGWAHFGEGPETVAPAFGAAGLLDRLVECPPGLTVPLKCG